MNPAKRIEMTGANGGPVLVADLNLVEEAGKIGG
jgi:hypothetical protein